MAKRGIASKKLKKVDLKVDLKRVKWSPLSGGFMVVSILGLIVSVYIIKKYPSWGFAFAIVFVVMLIASLISMRHAPLKGLK